MFFWLLLFYHYILTLFFFISEVLLPKAGAFKQIWLCRHHLCQKRTVDLRINLPRSINTNPICILLHGY